MLHRTFKDNTVVVTFKDSVYPFELVVEVLNEFKESCWVAIYGEDQTNFKVYIEPKDSSANVEIAYGEFFNYLLGLMRAADIK
ncbi:MAG: hypothetical protein PWP03_759 [Candidatus Woesearchaeota archaeon]|nr:hypothetical protein [Candidatus Woesearchaeota archaeon]MDN5328121.1 hypothetical protein [Candidatus Woesearchaeota archaeon]